jgi:hypothetical protein
VEKVVLFSRPRSRSYGGESAEKRGYRLKPKKLVETKTSNDSLSKNAATLTSGGKTSSNIAINDSNQESKKMNNNNNNNKNNSGGASVPSEPTWSEGTSVPLKDKKLSKFRGIFRRNSQTDGLNKDLSQTPSPQVKHASEKERESPIKEDGGETLVKRKPSNGPPEFEPIQRTTSTFSNSNAEDSEEDDLYDDDSCSDDRIVFNMEN